MPPDSPRFDANSVLLQRVVFGLILLVGSAFLLYGARDTWFFGDDWAFIVGRRQLWADGRYAEYLLAPHNEHWSTIPVLIHGALFRLFGLHSYAPYIVPVIACHVGICVALRMIMRRAGVGPWLATAGAALFLLLGSGAENLVWGFQLGFVAAALLGLVQLLLADHAGALSVRDVAAVVVGVLAVMTAGVAITMVAVVVVALLLRRRWLAAVIQGGVPALLYASWYLGYGRSRIVSPPSDASLVPAYVGTGLSNALDQIMQLPTVGLAVGLTAVALGVLARLGPVDRLTPALAMALGSVLLFAVNGLGRAIYGLEQARASRYVYLACAVLLPILMLALQALMLMRRAGRTIGWALLTWAIIGNLGAYFVQRQGRLDLLAQTRPRIEAAAGYADRPWVDPNVRPEPTYDPDITMASLRSLLKTFDLDPADTIPADAALQAALDFGVFVETSAGSALPTDGVTVVDLVDLAVASTDGDCIGVDSIGPAPAVTFAEDDPGSVSLLTAGSGLILRVVDDQGTAVTPRSVPQTGQPTLLRFDIEAGRPVVDLPAGPTTMCGVTLL